MPPNLRQWPYLVIVDSGVAPQVEAIHRLYGRGLSVCREETFGDFSDDVVEELRRVEWDHDSWLWEAGS